MFNVLESGEIYIQGKGKVGVTISYTGNTAYGARVDPNSPDTIDIGRQPDPDQQEIYSGSYTQPGKYLATEGTILHEVLHLCGSKGDIATEAMVLNFFSAVNAPW